MPSPSHFALYVAAAFLLAITPGPGLFYVAARALAGGRAEGMASSFGTGLGGMVHVVEPVRLLLKRSFNLSL